MTRLFVLSSGKQSGIHNMALDEALLEWARHSPEPVFLFRSYQWEMSTVSLGVNQPLRDAERLMKVYCHKVQRWVRRPTGGRAILHGADLSFSFVTNNPAFLRKSLAESYAQLTQFIADGLSRLAISTQTATAASNRDYMRSPVCFETHTPSDLLNEQGQKIGGSAQLRRAGGLLHQGALFAPGLIYQEAELAHAMAEVLRLHYRQPIEWVSPAQSVQLYPDFLKLRAAYTNHSQLILESVSTISGSQRVPASSLNA